MSKTIYRYFLGQMKYTNKVEIKNIGKYMDVKEIFGMISRVI